MKKVGRLSLLNLTDKCSLINKDSQKSLIGGGSGTPDDPFTEEEYNYLFYSGQWQGGCVEGMGWVTPDVYIYAEKPGGYGGYTKPGSGGSGGSGGSLWPGWPGGGSAGSYPGHNNYYPNHNVYPGNNNYSQPYSYYGYYGYHSSGGGGGGWGGSDNSSSLTDGVNINDSRHFTFNTNSQPVFNEQLTSILKSNSVIKTLLSYFDKGYVHLTFSLEDMAKNVTAYTTWKSYDSYHMVFNSQYATEQGWDIPLEGIDNIGYDRSKVKTTDEALVVTLTHEAIHANHFAIFNDAFLQADKGIYETYNILQEKGYSQEFIDIFIDKETNEWTTNEQRDINMHEYMKKYDHDVIDAALEEYRNDFK